MYSLKSVSELTGLTPETLRAWERRYQAVTPQRDHNRRRIYTAEDVRRLSLLSQACRQGHAISKLVGLPSHELEALLRAPSRGSGVTALVRRLIEAVESYRSDLCDEILGLAATSLSPMALAQEVLVPALQEVGHRWASGTLSIAQEHLLTSSVERMLMVLIHTYQKQVAGPGILFSTLSNERHQIGILLVAFIAASHRLRCYYFGTGLPAEEIVRAAVKTGVRAIAVSMVTADDVENGLEDLRHLSRHRPAGCEIWVGGQGAAFIADAALPDHCLRMVDLEEYRRRLSLLAMHR